METTIFNQAQLDLLRMVSLTKTQENLNELKKAIATYFAQKAKQEIEKMWETGEMNEEKYNSFRDLHQRTPYYLPRNAEHSA